MGESSDGTKFSNREIKSIFLYPYKGLLFHHLSKQAEPIENGNSGLQALEIPQKQQHFLIRFILQYILLDHNRIYSNTTQYNSISIIQHNSHHHKPHSHLYIRDSPLPKYWKITSIYLEICLLNTNEHQPLEKLFKTLHSYGYNFFCTM